MKINDNYMPDEAEVERYLRKWQQRDNYRDQEHAIDKLFLKLCPYNDNIEDILIKCSALNESIWHV